MGPPATRKPLVLLYPLEVIMLLRFTLVYLVCAALLSSCGKNPVSPPTEQGYGSVHLNLRIIKPATGAAKAAATTWDSLIIQVGGSDMAVVRIAKKISPALAAIMDTLNNIPAGTGRKIDVSTKTTSGATVHTTASRTIDLAVGETKQVSFILSPVAGSIYVDLTDVPTTVDSVWACFIAAGVTIGCSREARASKSYLSIDYIPDGTSGECVIVGMDFPSGDTLYRARVPITFSANQNMTVSVPFSGKPTVIVADISVTDPGVTVVAGKMQNGDTVGFESGPLLISEIMYAADDSEYIELYNPTPLDTSFDTLIVEVDGTQRIYRSIVVKSHDFYVIGRRQLPWADTFSTVSTALDLSSTTGNWIAVRTKTRKLIDWVAFAAGSNNQSWPRISGKVSIVLDSLVTDPRYNNYGMNWRAATTPIDLSRTAQLGTPGVF
jgi:hypothetical protein